MPKESKLTENKFIVTTNFVLTIAVISYLTYFGYLLIGNICFNMKLNQFALDYLEFPVKFSDYIIGIGFILWVLRKQYKR